MRGNENSIAVCLWSREGRVVRNKGLRCETCTAYHFSIIVQLRTRGELN